MNIVFVGIQNYKDLQIILNYSNFSLMLKEIAKQLEVIKRELKFLGDFFSDYAIYCGKYSSHVARVKKRNRCGRGGRS